MLLLAVFLFTLIPSVALGQDNDRVYRVGNGVSQPRVSHKVDPTFSKEAERERIQGTVLYSLIVDKSGKPRAIEVLSPLGYGLDEKGIESIRQWVFSPAVKDGMPVSVRATIEVNFRFEGLSFDTKTEKNRTSYNTAIHGLQTSDKRPKAIADMQKLAAEKYPPAMSAVGEWMIEGRDVAKDVSGGIELIRKAADRYDGNGLFAFGKLLIDGNVLPAEPEKGLGLIREASKNGNVRAQIYLGLKFESGDATIAVDRDRARYYFRLCAARGTAQCQFHLGKLLMAAPGDAKSDAVQSVAWLELARDGGLKDAEPLLVAMRQKMSDEEIRRAEKLKPELLRK